MVFRLTLVRLIVLAGGSSSDVTQSGFPWHCVGRQCLVLGDDKVGLPMIVGRMWAGVESAGCNSSLDQPSIMRIWLLQQPCNIRLPHRGDI